MGRLKLTLDLSVDTMVDLVVDMEDLVDLADIVTTLASVRLKPMLDSSVDTMVDLVVDMEDLLATVVDFMVDTVGRLPNRRANKELLSPFKIHTFDLNKLDKQK